MIRTLFKRSFFTSKTNYARKRLFTFSDDVTTAERTAFEVEPVTRVSEVKLFPWIQKENSQNLFQYLRNKFRLMRAKATFHIYTFGADHAEIDNIESGSKIALQCATAGIFGHELMKDHYFGVISKYKPTIHSSLNDVSFWAEAVPDLSDIFEEKLKDFYMYAIQKHCMEADRLLTYQLLEITEASGVDLAIMDKIKRGEHVPKYHSLISFWGLNTLFNECDIQGSLLSYHEKAKEIAKSQKDSSVRISVDVNCTGMC